MTAKDIQAQIAELQGKLGEAQEATLPKATPEAGEHYSDFSLEQVTVLRTAYLKNGTKIVRVYSKPGRSELRFENFDEDGEVTKSGTIAKNVPFPKRTTRR